MTAPKISTFVHPVAKLWPLLAEDELQRLADDIKANGLHNPIWRDREGRIVDGRNRWLACQRAGVECCHTFYEGDDGPALVRFVLSQNEMRRHLPIDQRAAIAAELAKVSHGGNRSKSSGEDLTQGQAAEVMGVSKQSVERAVALKKDAPDLHEKVKAGKMKAGKARKTAAERKGPVEVRHRLDDEEQTWRKPAPEPEAPPAAKPAKAKKPLGRGARWAEACAACRDAMAKLEERVEQGLGELESAINEVEGVQSEYQDWLDRMGDNLASSTTGQKLEEVTNLEPLAILEAVRSAIETARTKLEEAAELNLDEAMDAVRDGLNEAGNLLDEIETADLPVGFGRD